MVYAAWPESHLGDLEASAFTEQDVRRRDPGVVEGDVHVTVGGVVVAEHMHRVIDGDPRVVDRDEDLRLPAVGGTVGAGLHHGDHHFAPGVTGT